MLFLSDAEVPSGTERLSRKEEGHALDMLKYLALSPGANSESESQTRTSNRNSRRARTAQQAHEGVQTFASWVAGSEMTGEIPVWEERVRRPFGTYGNG